MRNRQLIPVLLATFLSYGLAAKEIVVGIEKRPIKNAAIVFTPLVIPNPVDLISAKMAFEYRLSSKFNIIMPVEAKWMDYRWAIKLGSSLLNGPSDIPESLVSDTAQVKVWNINFSQIKVSSGIGIKWFPFSEAMKNGFFLKTSILAGYERLNAYSKEGVVESAIFTHVLTAGYNWVWDSGLLFGFEFGEEYSLHTNLIRHFPTLFFQGFNPIAQLSLGFVF